MRSTTKVLLTALAAAGLASVVNADLPDPGMSVETGRTALVVTDPQNDFLSPDGVAWGVVGKNVQANDTVANLERLFKAAKQQDVPVFVSPHYYYPTDHGWRFEGPLERLMHNIGMFDRVSPLSLEGFTGSGADWLERYVPYIEDGATVVTNPHKVYGPESNDLVLQLRKRGIDKVILGGMSANLCTESHMRELVELGFEVMVVTDATAGAITEHSKWRSCLTPLRPLSYQRATAMPRRSSTSATWPTPSGPQARQSGRWRSSNHTRLSATKPCWDGSHGAAPT